MEYIRLGKTGLIVSRSAFDTGALVRAVQDGACEADAAAELLYAAYEGGINFFYVPFCADACTRMIGALTSFRTDIYIACASDAKNGADLKKDAEYMLSCMQTDYIDLYCVRDQGVVPQPDGRDGLCAALDELHGAGKIAHTGFITENFTHMRQAAFSPFWQAVQFPFHFLLREKHLHSADICLQNDTGFIAAEPLAGGRIEHISLAFGFLRTKENTLTLWRIRTKDELEQILYFEKNPPATDELFFADIEKEKKRLL